MFTEMEQQKWFPRVPSNGFLSGETVKVFKTYGLDILGQNSLQNVWLVETRDM